MAISAPTSQSARPRSEISVPGQAGQSGSADALRRQYERQNSSAESNLLVGSAAAFAASMIGSAIWATITAVTHFQIGWMAVGVGFLAGFAMRMFGKGGAPSFGIASALLALIGCMIGNYVAICVDYAAFEQLPLGDVLSATTPEQFIGFMILGFHPMDLLFYGLAVWFGYKYAFEPEATPEQSSARPNAQSPESVKQSFPTVMPHK